MKDRPRNLEELVVIKDLAKKIYVSACAVVHWENEHTGADGSYLDAPSMRDCIEKAEEALNELYVWHREKIEEYETYKKEQIK